MDKKERANWRAKSAIIEYLVFYERAEDKESSIQQWEQLTIDKLLEAKEYNVKRNVCVETILERYLKQYMDLCITLAKGENHGAVT